MLPLTEMASRVWKTTHGRGIEEKEAKYTTEQFATQLMSNFGKVQRPDRSRTFHVGGITTSGPGMPCFSIHTSGRRPSSVTIRTLRAAAAVLSLAYGPCQSSSRKLDVFLHDDPRPKVFPTGTFVRTQDINSGFSSPGKIVVFRCSEMHRTLVHELVHAWGVHGSDSKRAQAIASRELGAPSDCLLTESYVEAVTWLVHGGFCPTGLDTKYALSTAHAYLDVMDDGRTNGWAYFVGKALLVMDGGRRFHDTFFAYKGDELGDVVGVRLCNAGTHRSLVHIMTEAYPEFRRATKSASTLASHRHAILLCPCSLGSGYEAARGV